MDGTATPLVTNNLNCPSTVGCYEIDLTADSSAPRANLIGLPLPYPVGWWDVVIEVNGTAYTPDAAEAAGYVDKQYWVYNYDNNNNGGYDTYDDVTPGMVGTAQPFQGLWLKVNPASYGHTVIILIPAIPKVSQADPPGDTSSAASPRWLNWLFPAAHAAPPERVPARGKRARDEHRRRHAEGIQTGREWYVRLIVEEPDAGRFDRNNVLGQLDDSKVGYDSHDLEELAPFGDTYLTLVFPHPNWRKRAGDYASDYRPVKRNTRWSFEIRTDSPGREVLLRWAGSPEILADSVLVDPATGERFRANDPAYADGYPVFMDSTVRTLKWVYKRKSVKRSQ
jgi:hypothetical protein